MKHNYGEYICAGAIGFCSMAIGRFIEGESIMRYVTAGMFVFVGLYFIVKINNIEEKIK